MGFCCLKTDSKKHVSTRPSCGACGLSRKCVSPKMKPMGLGKKEILIVGGTPGHREDNEGIQVAGVSGLFLTNTLAKLGIDCFGDCWYTNAVLCKTGNVKNQSKYVDFCRPTLLKTIKELKPKVIILLGNLAVKSLIAHTWGKNKVGSVARWAGFQIPCREYDAWICPTYEPFFVKQEDHPALDLLFMQHIQKAVELKGRPWNGNVPDYGKDVECIYEADKAAKILRKMIKRGGRVAFDYETNMLQPYAKEAQIFSCSVCWEGKKTISFPWHGEAIKVMGELLRSSLKKIVWNLKMEKVWSEREFGFEVNNWLWDGMIAEHVIDNRPGLTGLKTHAFLRIGQPIYDDGVSEFFRTKRPNTPNRIDQADLGRVLKYGGMDALLTFKIAKQHFKEIL